MHLMVTVNWSWHCGFLSIPNRHCGFSLWLCPLLYSSLVPGSSSPVLYYELRGAISIDEFICRREAILHRRCSGK